MNWPIFVLAVVGILLQAYAAFLFAKTWLLSDQIITALSATKYGSNPALLNLFLSSRRTTYQGLTFLTIGIILSLAALFLQAISKAY